MVTAPRLTCRDCGATFESPPEERALFAEHGWPPPKRCMPCRHKVRQAHEAAGTRVGAFDDIELRRANFRERQRRERKR